MANFAEIDDSNKVIRVLVLDDKDTQDPDGNEVESIGAKYLHEGFGGTWLNTSIPSRKNIGIKGATYDETKNAFNHLIRGH